MMENVIFMRTVIRTTVKTIRSKPKAGSVEADHLVSFQNRMWFYDLLMSCCTAGLQSGGAGASWTLVGVDGSFAHPNIFFFFWTLSTSRTERRWGFF